METLSGFPCETVRTPSSGELMQRARKRATSTAPFFFGALASRRLPATHGGFAPNTLYWRDRHSGNKCSTGVMQREFFSRFLHTQIVA
jgi:hypothetical protein